jgi:hypothetical protein
MVTAVSAVHPVRAARLARGWSQSRLARRAQINESMISGIETWRMFPYPPGQADRACTRRPGGRVVSARSDSPTGPSRTAPYAHEATGHDSSTHGGARSGKNADDGWPISAAAARERGGRRHRSSGGGAPRLVLYRAGATVSRVPPVTP